MHYFINDCRDKHFYFAIYWCEISRLLTWWNFIEHTVSVDTMNRTKYKNIR